MNHPHGLFGHDAVDARTAAFDFVRDVAERFVLVERRQITSTGQPLIE